MADATIHGIDIHTYLVKDASRAISFWRDTMGLTPSWQSEQGAEFELPDGSTFGLWKMDDDSWMPGNGVMFAVADVHAASARFRDRGVRIDEHIEETPVCHMAFAQDSEGNAFMLHQRKVH
ncbi:MAG: VOC family protein [Vulcanimicrobiaceae bacterium]